MKMPSSVDARRALIFLVCVIWPAQFARAQFVGLTADVEVGVWNPKGVRTRTTTIHCVVGTNAWQMDGDFAANARESYLFTGTNLIENIVITKDPPDELKGRINQPGMPFGTAPPLGRRSTRLIESVDGNPGQTVRQGDHLTMVARIAWLAFCSGPCLKREGRAIFPPDDLWKEMVSTPSFKDMTTVFDDALGLPKTIDLFAPKNQQVMQYRVVSSTNVLGSEFPLEFYLAQYQPARVPGKPFIIAGTNGWELDFVAKGIIKAIGERGELQNFDTSSDTAKPANK
jgi:hypothetical protein